MDNINTFTDAKCHSCFENKSKTNLVSIMLGMTVCFSTLWRFPYQAANFGGAGFIAVYLVMAALFVYPALTAEWGLGRLTGRGPDGAFKNVKFPKSRAVSALLFAIVLAIGSYFAVWIGWILRYAYSSLTDPNLAKPATDSAKYFDLNVAGEPVIQLIFAALVIALVAPVIFGGQNRIQKVSRYIVPLFYVSVLGMTIFILIQPNVFSETIGYLTAINISQQITPYTFLTALGQAFFSLCLGGTFMVLYGSYMDRKENHNIPSNAGFTIVGNTIASLISIFLIIGIVKLAGIGGDLTEFGPGLFFGVIPEAFQALSSTFSIGFARILMVLFFVMFFFAAYLPMTAIIEVNTVTLVDQFGISRKQAFGIVSVATLILAIPSAISPHAGGFLYNLDVFVGAIGLVVGSILAIIAFTWYVPEDRVLEEVNAGSNLKLGRRWLYWTKYVTPVAFVLVVLYVLSDFLVRTATGLYEVQESDYVLYDRIVTYTPSIMVFLTVLSISLIYYDRRSSRNEIGIST